MKRSFLMPEGVNGLSFALVFFLFFCISCSEQEKIADQLDTEAENLATEELAISSDFEALEATVDEALVSQDESIEARKFEEEEAGLGNCAVITNDQPNKTITVDFGDACTGRDGKIRSGQIIITYTGPKYRPGTIITTLLVDYVVDSVRFEGVRTTTNISTDETEPISLNTVLVGGKAIYPDGSEATREFDYTRTWIRASRPSLDKFSLVGSASGTRRNGSSYTVEILEEVIFQRSCGLRGRHIPVSGKKEIQRNDNEALILDYGDGSCDRLATVSRGDESRQIRL